jgi:alpha-amylase/alpha-mannosidase (GH57 family)
MAVSLCIHGHFYQPPREDPWLGRILIEASAAPMRHWNERILRESYAPLAWARRLDSEGKIADILNVYEWISFNAGPTLLQWMRRAAPEVVLRMREGDAHSRLRWGYGNAMAQIYHHVIMPLATPRDRDLEVRWAIDDFRFHFGRDPEGMWLSECAVDVLSLESLAARGVRFVILAPRQAKAVIVNGKAMAVNEGSLNIGEAYTLSLPSGASMTAIFYHGGLSQGIAFEGLLRNGESFWNRIAGEAAALAGSNSGVPLLTLATDGETYGHHFTFGEMALAYVLAQGYAKRDNIRLSNPAAHIAAHPPVHEVILHEPSSWSCVHGIERWRSDCGCSDGGHGGWNQRWRGPLRAALDVMRAGVEAYFARVGKECFVDAEAALAAYGEVLADPAKSDAFAATRFRGSSTGHDKAWRLLAMQEQSLAAFASCAWFFDDIARIEPENAMTFALRAMELLQSVGGPDLSLPVMKELEKAASNDPALGSGASVYVREVLPRRDDVAAICLLAYLLLDSEGKLDEAGACAVYAWPNVSAELVLERDGENGQREGRAVIRTNNERVGAQYVWRITPPGKLRYPGSSFVPLVDAEMSVRRQDAGREAEQRRKAREFSRPLRDWLLSQFLQNREKLKRPEMRAAAAHALSLSDSWLESQHNVPTPEYWIDFMPYMPVEAMCNDAVTDRQRIQLKTLFEMHLSARDRTLAAGIIREQLLDGLEPDGRLAGGQDRAPSPRPGDGKSAGPCDDATLALWMRRARAMTPDMECWAVQNKVWERGLKLYPLLAKELGFHE